MIHSFIHFQLPFYSGCNGATGNTGCMVEMHQKYLHLTQFRVPNPLTGKKSVHSQSIHWEGLMKPLYP